MFFFAQRMLTPRNDSPDYSHDEVITVEQEENRVILLENDRRKTFHQIVCPRPSDLFED